MDEGLVIISVKTGTWRNITFVGWLRRKGGDEYELLPGARIVTRHGSVDWNGLDDLAAEGPNKKYKFYPPMKTAEPLNRLLVGRCKAANVKAWAKECPAPKGWSEELGTWVER